MASASPLRVPANLHQMLCTPGESAKYEMSIGYYAERIIEDGVYHPLVLRRTNARVITFDKKLLAQAWRTVEPRTSRIREASYYVNWQTGTTFQYSSNLEEQQSVLPEQFFSHYDLEKETLGGNPFAWEGGVNDQAGLMGRDTFQRLIDEATAEKTKVLRRSA